jgi:hypothetical protein
VLAKVRTHGFEHLRQNRRGGVIVEVDPGHRSTILPVSLAWLAERLRHDSLL